MSKVVRLEDGTVTLRGVKVALTSDIGRAYVTDCARNWEKILPNSVICEKWDLSVEAWQAMGANKQLVQAVRSEHERRIRNGTCAQETAAREFAHAPATLGAILRDPGANARHKIEAHRELRATESGTCSECATGDTSYRFVITINLGASTEDKTVIDCGKIKPRALSWEGDNPDGMAD
jgi:hypothetical protein